MNYDSIAYNSDDGVTWWPYGNQAFDPLPWSVVANNDTTPTIYVISGAGIMNASTGGAPFVNATPPFPVGYGFGQNNGGGVATVALDIESNDVYVVGWDNNGSDNIRVYKSLAGDHGQVWREITGTIGVAPFPKINETANSIAVDPSSHSVLIGTEGASVGNGNPPPAGKRASIYRLNGPDAEASGHWRPWINGLPHGIQPIHFITGEYENGVYYYYAATWGRAVWRREARGGDL